MRRKCVWLFICAWIETVQLTQTLPPREAFRVDSSKWNGQESYSGFLTVNKKYDSNLFFWYFPTRDAGEHTPWIIWLQGGPGASSLIGVFDVNGPFLVKGNEVHLRNDSWTGNYSMLYIDNPVGAGFSYVRDDKGYTSSEQEVGEQLLEFLRQFLQLFPELRTRPLFVAGESYGGKYVPTLAWYLHRQREKQEYRTNLRGVMIGNGLIDPRSMMHYTELCLALGMVDDQQAAVLRTLETDAVKLLDAGKMVDAANKFNETIEYIKKRTSVNYMNFNADGPAQYSFLDLLKKPEVRESIHVGNASYDVNNQLVYEKMLPDFMNTTKPFVEELLEHYGVLCYSGQLDVVLPYSGSAHLYSALRWSLQHEYGNATRTMLRLTPDGPVYGYKKSGGRFTEVLIRKAGHIAPKDNPEAARAVVEAFIQEHSGVTRDNGVNLLKQNLVTIKFGV